MPQGSGGGNRYSGDVPSRIMLTEVLLPLVGVLTPRPPRPRDQRDRETTFGDELGQRIDEVPWYEWISGDTRLLDTGTIDACGCPIYHWYGAENSKSAVLHDGCEYGNGIHIFSGTMQHDLDLPEHCSRLRLAAALHGVPFHEAAAAVGIDLIGQTRLTPLTADDLEARADELAAEDNHALAAKMRRAAAVMRSATYVPPLVQDEGRVMGGAVPSGTATASDGQPLNGSAPTNGSAATNGHGGTEGGNTAADSDGDQAARSVKDRARKVLLSATEPALLDRIFCTPELIELRERARLAMESPMVKLMADLSACLSLLPPTVTLPPIVTDQRASLNFMHAVVGRSGAGKSGATRPTFVPDTATGPGTVPGDGHSLPAPRSVGSGEAIAGLFAHVETDKDGVKTSHIHTESARMYWPEITKIIGVKSRQGSSLAPELCQVVSGEPLGSDTKTNTCYVGAHVYRATVTIGAQLATVGGLFDTESAVMGLSQRLWLASAEMTDLPAEGTPQWEALMEADPVAEQVTLKIAPFKIGSVAVDPAVKRATRVLRYRHSTGEETDELEMETHVALMRLKLAVAAAVRHGEPPAVTAKWWEWTEHLLEHHSRVRRAGQIASRISRTVEAVEQGRFDANRADARDAAQHANAVQATLRWAKKQGGAFTLVSARRGARYGTYRRDNIEGILDQLVSTGDLVEESVNVANHGDVLHYRTVG